MDKYFPAPMSFILMVLFSFLVGYPDPVETIVLIDVLVIYTTLFNKVLTRMDEIRGSGRVGRL